MRTPSVTEMVQKLDEDGLLIYEKYKGITLTSDGQKIAKSVSKRHNLLFDLLTTLGVDEEIANRDACGIEHCLNPESVEAITRLLTQLKSPAGKKLLEELDQV
ncbi:MAG: Iron dependent repressor [Candidatus Syntrophoarchaeum caldarius]|uniref:Iron dependent repressor n=1 Tax=Candidatus Syntropharchaeum caldarium TaxID=1838285 RepID=A0A1F2P8A6_9EURY|nr:MAG: Iron dependent repressor [Candidatus Syntrophoarchaeum caldarius]